MATRSSQGGGAGDGPAIVEAVRSVADALRAEDREVVRALATNARVRLALALGARDLESFRLAHDPPLAREEAGRRLERQRQSGRRPCRCIEELIG
jgi:hypothetical protein